MASEVIASNKRQCIWYSKAKRVKWAARYDRKTRLLTAMNWQSPSSAFSPSTGSFSASIMLGRIRYVVKATTFHTHILCLYFEKENKPLHLSPTAVETVESLGGGRTDLTQSITKRRWYSNLPNKTVEKNKHGCTNTTLFDYIECQRLGLSQHKIV